MEHNTLFYATSYNPWSQASMKSPLSHQSFMRSWLHHNEPPIMLSLLWGVCINPFCEDITKCLNRHLFVLGGGGGYSVFKVPTGFVPSSPPLYNTGRHRGQVWANLYIRPKRRQQEWVRWPLLHKPLLCPSALKLLWNRPSISNAHSASTWNELISNLNPVRYLWSIGYFYDKVKGSVCL